MDVHPRDLPGHLGLTTITDFPKEEIADAHIENCAGFVKIPLGIAGPLHITGNDGHVGASYAAMGTIEGTLVASTCRGAKALNMSGGLKYEVLSEGIHRDPSIIFETTDDAVRFLKEWPLLRNEFISRAEATSNYLKFIHDKAHVVGTAVHLLVKFHTAGAAGQNIITIGCQAALDWIVHYIKPRYAIRHFLVEGLSGSDKHMSRQAITGHRGVEVMAWGKLTDDACRKVLGLSTRSFIELHQTFVSSTVRAGYTGHSANTDNILAAILVGTGQDIASVGESSWCQLTMDYNFDNGDINLTIYYPNIVIAVVGGATAYPGQREGLKIMGCDSPNSKLRLAGLIAGFAMALDISCLSALGTNTFTDSHQRLGRRKVLGSKAFAKQTKL